MTDNYLLKTADAQDIYFKIKDLPIVDYHCHLSPKEIYEDKPFDNIGEMWLGGDHYKWRLMRTAGIDERYITGNTDWREKFIKYAAALELAAGNPLYHWSHMELSMFFDIDKPLKSDNARRNIRRGKRLYCKKQTVTEKAHRAIESRNPLHHRRYY